MECKKALEETNGDFDAAVKLLRERGAAVAAKRADREAKEGKVEAIVSADGRCAAMIEVNCETDFVTRNADFQAFVAELRGEALDHATGEMATAIADRISAKVASIGEKIQLRRNVRWEVEGTGTIASYIHLGGKVGVLIELGCGKAETASNPAFQELAKDLTLHVAAAAPQYLSREDVPADIVETEKDIFRKQLLAEDEEKGKSRPAEMVNNILKGKINKFYSQICFVEQAFVKDDKVAVNALVAQKAKEVGDALAIKRYVRYQLGGA
jgi:elongation factor Ts